MKHSSGHIRNGGRYACVGTRIQWKVALLSPQICCELLGVKKKKILLKKEKNPVEFSRWTKQSKWSSEQRNSVHKTYFQRKLKEKGIW